MFGNYINGEWINTEASFENRNPATGELVGVFAKGRAADINAAAEAAAAAFPGWSNMAGPSRGAILYKAADILDKNFDAIAADMATVFEKAPNGYFDQAAGRRLRTASPATIARRAHPARPLCRCRPRG